MPKPVQGCLGGYRSSDENGCKALAEARQTDQRLPNFSKTVAFSLASVFKTRLWERLHKAPTIIAWPYAQDALSWSCASRHLYDQWWTFMNSGFRHSLSIFPFCRARSLSSWFDAKSGKKDLWTHYTRRQSDNFPVARYQYLHITLLSQEKGAGVPLSPYHAGDWIYGLVAKVGSHLLFCQSQLAKIRSACL